MTKFTKATITDLYALPHSVKAELVEGCLEIMPLEGDMPSRAAGTIFAGLHAQARETGVGRAYMSRVAYVVDLPHRESFSPDASLYVGPDADMKFLQGAPVFAVEVRSENDYGPTAERMMAQKRADYFACGTLVVWDVDLLGDDVVRSYWVDQPYTPTVFRRGDTASAEPAVPGWTIPVNTLFE
jgi:Uma2 family endonuclease